MNAARSAKHSRIFTVVCHITVRIIVTLVKNSRNTRFQVAFGVVL
jgi:hypothetical protein